MSTIHLNCFLIVSSLSCCLSSSSGPPGWKHLLVGLETWISYASLPAESLQHYCDLYSAGFLVLKTKDRVYLHSLRLLRQNTRDCVAYTQQKFILCSSGGWQSRCLVGACLLVRRVEGTRQLSGVSYKGSHPFVRVPLSCPDHLSKAPSPNVTVVGVRISHRSFWGTFKL